MTKRDTETRDKIIEAASQLIREQGGTESVTTRDIAARAGVGVGLINYHFQTKEHLLDLCIQRIISRVIDGFDALTRSVDLPPVDKLRFLLKQNMRFLVENPGISRASILHDIHTPGGGDNTAQTLQAYLPVVRAALASLSRSYPSETCGEEVDEGHVVAITHCLIYTLQILFLRGGAGALTSGCDPADPEQRDRFIDALIDRMFLNS